MKYGCYEKGTQLGSVVMVEVAEKPRGTDVRPTHVTTEDEATGKNLIQTELNATGALNRSMHKPVVSKEYLYQ